MLIFALMSLACTAGLLHPHTHLDYTASGGESNLMENAYDNDNDTRGFLSIVAPEKRPDVRFSVFDSDCWPTWRSTVVINLLLSISDSPTSRDMLNVYFRKNGTEDWSLVKSLTIIDFDAIDTKQDFEIDVTSLAGDGPASLFQVDVQLYRSVEDEPPPYPEAA